MKQEILGDLIGVSFQQVQKYEKGTNRVATSMLLRIAEALETDPSTLLPKPGSAPAEPPSPDDVYARRVVASLAVLNQTGRRVLADVAKALLENVDLRK